MRCPICKREVDEKERDKPKSFYPFCSERCKLIDLGRWLGGKYQIPCDNEEAPDATPPLPDDPSA
ncbi:MAG TPA: DNA gyrase inhibitor YacG [Tepidisphaeraceae bacterium]|nr:DNA gyrase inhibitor YacG [Tepidisphaeraceae bacterium]